MFKRIHQKCPVCDSSDGAALNEDGSAKCFSCGAFVPSKNIQPTTVEQHIHNDYLKKQKRMPIINFDIGCRGLRSDVTKKYGYGLTVEGLQAANYYAADQTTSEVAQKIRKPDKTFFWVGEKSRSFLFGQQLFLQGGHTLIVTEGEIDALTVAQEVIDPRACVVSLSDGAASAKSVLQRQRSFLGSFKNVVLLFDNDEPGQSAAA